MTQEEALEILKMGHSVFLTGAPGTGKTYILNRYINYLKSHQITPAITASTGIAATHINGKTIHAWSGIGVYDKLDDWVLDKLEQNEKLFKRYRDAKVLIIDEISMLHASKLSMLDTLARRFRQNDSSFGGLQVILTGDFFQLPPVVKNYRDNGVSQEDEFAYNSEAWKSLNPVVCYLEENYRQEDESLENILNNIRKSENLEQVRATLENNSTSNKEDNLKLYTHNVDVDSINFRKYSQILSDEEYDYSMTSHGKASLVENLKKNCLARESLSLKIGTKVIFIKNSKDNLYQNGTLGEVTNFVDGLPEVKTLTGRTIKVSAETWSLTNDDGKVVAEISQLPLNYAWAITVHKSQGMTLDSAEIDLSRAFGTGMGYVALSRVRSLTNLCLLGLNSEAFLVSEQVKVRDKTFQTKSKNASVALAKYLEHGKVSGELKKKQEDFILKNGGDLAVSEVEEEDFIEKKPTTIFTLEFMKNQIPLLEIAKVRSLTLSTIISHLEKLLKSGELNLSELEYILQDYEKLYTKKDLETIKQILKQDLKLKEKYEKLNKDLKIKVDYDTLKVLSLGVD